MILHVSQPYYTEHHISKKLRAYMQPLDLFFFSTNPFNIS